MVTRKPSSWGFHPFDPQMERDIIEECITSKFGPGKISKTEKGYRRIIGAVSPHAGYIYSGPIAAHVYHALAADGLAETYVVIGPNHRGYPGVFMMTEGIWKMPMGDIQVDDELAKEILNNSKSYLEDNPDVHDEEHSIEVQLPFLQYVFDNKFKIVPMTMGLQTYEVCEKIGTAIAKAAKTLERDIVIIGSTDFTHYGAIYGYAPAGSQPIDEVVKWIYGTDRKLMDHILSLEPKKLVETVEDEGLTLCGYGPIATMIIGSKELGAKTATLLKYATSYDIQGNSDAIVGYGALILEK